MKLIREREKTVAQAARDLGVDNDETHKHPRVKPWLQRHQRFHLHSIPTSSSWLHWVVRWFRELSDKRIRRGSFKSLPELIAAIGDDLDHHNQSPHVFVWMASVERIRSKVSTYNIQKRWMCYT